MNENHPHVLRGWWHRPHIPTRGKDSGGFSSSRDSARDSRTSPTDLGMRWGASNSSNDRRVREGTCRRGKMLVAHVINEKTNDSPFLRP